MNHSPLRIGARERVLGQTRFGADLARPGDLFLACARSEKAPMILEGIDGSAAMAIPGVVRVFTAADIPGSNRLGIIPVTKDQEFLAERVVRHPGQAVALVAAETAEAARAGVKALGIRLKAMTGVHDPALALAPGAPLVHEGREGGNLLAERNIIKGQAEGALGDCAVVVKGRYTTSAIEHGALETEAGRAEVIDGRLVVWACTQNPHYDRQDLALFLGLDEEKVRVVQAETGGGFGGKLDLSVQPYLGLAAWLLGRPVRMVYTREESFQATAKRHPFVMDYVTGADEQGRIQAMQVDLLADTGAFASYGLAVCMRAAVHATGPYFVPNLSVRCRVAYTNNHWSGAMRGFGVPQAAMGHEAQMDQLAAALGMDPLELRMINALEPGQAIGTGQVLESGVGIRRCLEAIAPSYRKWSGGLSSSGGQAMGVGLGAMFYGIGNTGVSNPAGAQVQWTADNRVVLFTGAADIGQGSDTVLCQLAAEALGLPFEKISLIRGDTDRTTNAGATSASRQTYISGNAVMQAAKDLESIILAGAEDILEAHRQDLYLEGEHVAMRGYPERGAPVVDVVRRLAGQGKQAMGRGGYDPATVALDPETGQGSPYEAYAFAAQAAEVSVERASGMVKVTRVCAAHDVGKAVNKKAVQGQIAGGVVMGVGLALMEEFHPGQKNLADYHMPTIKDAPEIDIHIIEEPAAAGPMGAKGVGEPALVPTAPAVASAVAGALGRPMRHLPMNLERVMAALGGEDLDTPASGDGIACE